MHKDLYQMYDQMHCRYCGKSWSVDDRDVPECVPAKGGDKPVVVHSVVPCGRFLRRSMMEDYIDNYRMVAWLAWQRGYHNVAILLYAYDKASAVQYASSVMQAVDVEVTRLGALDGKAFGGTPYSEFSPDQIRLASSLSKRKVVSLSTWWKGQPREFKAPKP